MNIAIFLSDKPNVFCFVSLRQTCYKENSLNWKRGRGRWGSPNGMMKNPWGNCAAQNGYGWNYLIVQCVLGAEPWGAPWGIGMPWGAWGPTSGPFSILLLCAICTTIVHVRPLYRITNTKCYSMIILGSRAVGIIVYNFYTKLFVMQYKSNMLYQKYHIVFYCVF